MQIPKEGLLSSWGGDWEHELRGEADLYVNPIASQPPATSMGLATTLPHGPHV